LTGLVIEQSNVLKDVGWWQSFVWQTFEQYDDVILADGAQTSGSEAPACPSHATTYCTIDHNNDAFITHTHPPSTHTPDICNLFSENGAVLHFGAFKL